MIWMLLTSSPIDDDKHEHKGINTYLYNAVGEQDYDYCLSTTYRTPIPDMFVHAHESNEHV